MRRDLSFAGARLASVCILIAVCFAHHARSQTSPDPGAVPRDCNPYRTYDPSSRCQQPASVPNSTKANYQAVWETLDGAKKRKQLVASFDRRANKSELDALRPEKIDVDRYKVNLSDKAYDLFRLVPDLKCSGGGNPSECAKL